jgi:hypothetical protein
LKTVKARRCPKSSSRIAQPFLTDEPLHIAPLIRAEPKRHRSPCIVQGRRPTNGEADTHIIGRSLMGRYAKRTSTEMEPNRPHIPSSYRHVKEHPAT